MKLVRLVIDKIYEVKAFNKFKPLIDAVDAAAFGPGETTQMAPHMPTAPENMKNALVNSFEFWADHDSELNERFNAWIAN